MHIVFSQTVAIRTARISCTSSPWLESVSKATTRPTLYWVTSLQKSVTVEGMGTWVRMSWLSLVRFWVVNRVREKKVSSGARSTTTDRKLQLLPKTIFSCNFVSV